MNADPARRKATYQDVLDAPAHLVAEIIGGELVTHPRPAPAHAIASSALSDELSSPFQKRRSGPGGWIFADEPELHLGREIVVPDLAGWKRERLTRLPETAYFELAPDWVCEILSPSTASYDRGPKRRIYGDASVPYLWLLDLKAHQLEAFVRTGDHWLLAGTAGSGEQVSLPPFDAISFDFDILFPLDRPAEEPRTAD